MITYSLTSTDTTFSLSVNGESKGTWNKPTCTEDILDISGNNDVLGLSMHAPYYSCLINPAVDTITINGTPFSGTAAALKTAIRDGILTLAPGVTAVTVYQRKTILTDAQIKALPTTPVELVPAPGDGMFLFVHNIVVKKQALVANYTNMSQYDQIYVQYGSDGTVISYGFNWDNDRPVTDLLQLLTNDQGGNRIFRLPLKNTIQAPAGAMEVIGAEGTWLNRAVHMLAYSTLGNWTGGDPANTIEITVFYSIVDL